MKKCGTCKFYHNGCAFSVTENEGMRLWDFVACGQYIEHVPKQGDLIYHIDARNKLWVFKVTETNDNNFRIISDDDLKTESTVEKSSMPKPRLFYQRETAKLEQKRIQNNITF